MRPQGALQIPPLRSPGFPVKTRGFDDLHAALFTESRTRGLRLQREVGNPGSAVPSWKFLRSLKYDRMGGDDPLALLHGDGLIGRNVFNGVFVAARPLDGEPHSSPWVRFA